VDWRDPVSLAAFCADADLVLNCAGPSYRLLDTVARAAWAAGAHYVDTAGDIPAHRALLAGGHGGAGDRVAVLSAGLTPGLTGLLPRLVARPGDRLDVYAGGAVRVTPVSAVDILLSQGPDFGESFAVWRDGRVVPRALTPQRGVRLPGFPEPVDAWPFLSTEAARLAAGLGLAELRNHVVYASPAIPTALALAWADDPAHLEDHAPSLVAAADDDLRGRSPYHVLTCRARPAADGAAPARTLTLHTVDPYDLSGVVAALAARAVLRGGIEPGVHLAADVLDPRFTANALPADAAALALSLT
jgi:hypothetical protein